MNHVESRACRVCGEPVTPWRRAKEKPTVTIHEACLIATCKECGGRFTVGKERKGLFCCSNCHHRNRERIADGLLAC